MAVGLVNAFLDRGTGWRANRSERPGHIVTQDALSAHGTRVNVERFGRSDQRLGKNANPPPVFFR
jgi:hypothetical protein